MAGATGDRRHRCQLASVHGPPLSELYPELQMFYLDRSLSATHQSLYVLFMRLVPCWLNFALS
jgi:hypothetical protein